jgi:hypothetical protein
MIQRLGTEETGLRVRMSKVRDTQPAPTLIDTFLPIHDASERHATRARASPERIYAALRRTDLAASPLVRLLFGLRVLPLVFTGRSGAIRTAIQRLRMSIRLSDFEARGFTVLAEQPPTELLIGLVGTFWTASGGLRSVDATTVPGPPASGHSARRVELSRQSQRRWVV